MVFLSNDALSLDAFRALGQDHVLLDEPDSTSVRLRFIGPFDGRDVLWDAEFRALRDAGTRCIEIGPAQGDTRPLLVSLDIARFDQAAIRKTIIMIRQYKRLRQGRMCFGDSGRD